MALQHMSRRRKKIVFSLLMVALTAAACYVILEYVFARFYYSDVYLVSHVTYDPVIGWRLKPGTYKVKPPASFRKHTIHVNELGLRSKDPGESGGSGTRVVVLGDSFVYGRVIREDAVFTVETEKLLRREYGRETLEVVNAGVPGYGTAQELLLMRDLSERGITGDIYVLMVFTNDIMDNLRLEYGTLEVHPYRPGFVLDESGILEFRHHPQAKPEEEERVRHPRRRAHIIEAVKLRLEAFLQTRPRLIEAAARFGFRVRPVRLPAMLSSWYDDAVIGEGMPLMQALLKAVKCETEARGALLLVGFIPSELQVYSGTYGPLLKRAFTDSDLVDQWLADPERPQRVTGEMCRDLGIPFLDLLPVMIESSHEILYVPREGHLTEKGHSLVAASLAAAIDERLSSSH